MFFILYCIVACTESDELLPQNEESEKDQATLITVKNGMLVFPNDSIFGLAMMGEIELPFQMDFISQNDIFTQIMVEEEAHVDKLLKQGIEPTENDHSELYLQKLKSGFIKIVKYSDGAELYDLNLFKPQYAKILNEKGFYAIGKNIYQITANSTKLWVNGDINNYQLLAKANSSEESKGIYIVTSDKANIQTRLTPFKAPNLEFIVKYTAPTNIRTYVKVFDKTALDMSVIPPVSYKRETYIHVATQKKSGSNWSYYTDFAHQFSFRIYREDAQGNFLEYVRVENTTTGGNIYYNMMLTPEWSSIFQVSSLAKPGEYTTDYVYLGRFDFGITGKKAADNYMMGCECPALGIGETRTWYLSGFTGDCVVVNAIGE